MTLSAKYEAGVFKPLQDVQIEEGTVVEVVLPSEASTKKSPRIADSPAVGIWKDRTDMEDSVDYVNRLRRDLRG